MDTTDVGAYYATFREREWQRLERDEGVVEFDVTTAMLARHLPTSGRILDIGGGPGRYAIWLADRGYRVTLADISPDLLDIARSRLGADPPRSGALDEITEADARDLSRWRDQSFDAVLSLGPFYHLTDPTDRDRAAREVARVVRPGGVVFVALMPWLGFVRRSIWVADERRTFVSTHGFANGIESALAETRLSDPDAYAAALELLIDTADDPGLLGLGGHLLYVGERRDAGSRGSGIRDSGSQDRRDAR